MRLDRVLPFQRRVLAGIVDTLLPPAPALDDEARRRVSAAATRFVVIEVESIPTFLRLPYLFAILGFQLLAVARYARPFTALPVEKQNAYVRLWTNSPIGVMRDFLKLIRGCSLLAYFDHPEVRSLLQQGRGTQPPLESGRVRAAAE
jgi:hypothetical protein